MSITYGPSGQPLQTTTNFDALFSSSLANYRKTMTDNISTSNFFFNKMKEMGLWEGRDGGLYMIEDLMYGLSPVDTYDGYDELPLTPTEGITQAQFQWRQIAAPVSISEKERKMNKQRIIDLIASKLKQCEIGMQEAFPKFLLQGSWAGSGTSLTSPYTSPKNGSVAFDPLPLLVAFDPTVAAATVGGIDPSVQTWWRNQTTTSAATSYTMFLGEVLHLYNNCSKGPGGPPKIAICDQTTWELFSAAYYFKYRTEAPETGDYPFPVINFFGTEVVWDQFMPNVYANTTDPTTTTGGTFYFLNPEFLKVVYENESNFVETEFLRPVNMDAKFKHILFMGGVTMNNRRKQGVLGKIARTLTAA